MIREILPPKSPLFTLEWSLRLDVPAPLKSLVVTRRGFSMKRLLAFLLVLSLLVVTGTLVAADAQTRQLKQTDSQEQWRQTDVIR
jgi:hypothetical protein